ncbi:MYD88 protein, partial [Podargus strigoides]|nr:MYD88 protein [Podargus strigoides]
LSPAGDMSSAPSRCGFAYDFSIWYCPKDEHVASHISERLKKEGFRGYTEHQDQVAGTSVIQSAIEAIEASRVAIILLSAQSLRDPWCQSVSQWNLTHSVPRHGTKIIPVRVGVKKAEVLPVLQHLTELEYQSEFFFERLVSSLRIPRAATGSARRTPSSRAE